MRAFAAGLFLLSFLLGCASKPANKTPDSTDAQASKPGIVERLAAMNIEGTVITVRLNESISSKRNKPGDPFTATVVQPVEADGKVVIPKGAVASGTVAEAVPLGRFKGGAKLPLSLDTVEINGNKYNVQASTIVKGKGQRTATFIGGGKGAAIGALADAGAGTAGSAFAGNRDIVQPSPRSASS